MPDSDTYKLLAELANLAARTGMLEHMYEQLRTDVAQGTEAAALRFVAIEHHLALQDTSMTTLHETTKQHHAELLTHIRISTADAVKQAEEEWVGRHGWLLELGRTLTLEREERRQERQHLARMGTSFTGIAGSVFVVLVAGTFNRLSWVPDTDYVAVVALVGVIVVGMVVWLARSQTLAEADLQHHPVDTHKNP